MAVVEDIEEARELRECLDELISRKSWVLHLLASFMAD
jgi:hypothetical protein